MTHQFDGFNWLLRLNKGEYLIDSLLNFTREHNISGAWVSGIGAALSAELGFYDLNKKQYRWKKFDQLMEITSLQGNIAWSDGEPAVHIHGTFSDSDMRSFGGHVKELEVGGTCEVLLHRWYQDKLTRSNDQQTGLTLLDL
jgi:hypothetical protein